jgi:hypothetical protein
MNDQSDYKTNRKIANGIIEEKSEILTCRYIAVFHKEETDK